MNRRVRLKDIAQALGLSINTVSLALKDSSRINKETRLKVHQKAKELNYIPNSIARSLVQKKSNVIGFVLPRITNPIQIETAQAIERKLLLSGYNMMLMTTDHDAKYEALAIDILLSRQVDGIFLFPSKINNREKIKTIRESNVPIILLSGGEAISSSDAVYMNQFSGAYNATTHLISLGHHSIALIFGGMINDAEKHRGYKKALEDNGLQYDADLVVPVKKINYEQGYTTVAKLTEQAVFTAILAAGDYVALGALRWCHEHGIRVPEDIAIIGFDNLEDAEYSEVPLSSVTYEIEQVTDRATELLHSLIARQEKLSSLEPVHIEIESSLVIRDSCGYNHVNNLIYKKE